MASRQILLMSSSNLHGHAYLQHAKNDLINFFNKNNVTQILFIPYALKNYDEYTAKVATVLEDWGYRVEGIHTKKNPIEAVTNAQSIYIGGGNTFLLLKTLYEKNLVDLIHRRVVNEGVPYVGSSAGTNVATHSICTTNDMPIVYPPSFNALNLVPFNINPHYLDPDSNGKHKGETREQRIEEFHHFNENAVVGLREGTALYIDGDKITLKGFYNARLFQKGKKPMEYPPESDLSFLLFNNRTE
uniref:dipeptidase E n=1 Tax=Culicoides sonorensis TaxID=179676 RepID=A0A336LIB4_CULSO